MGQPDPREILMRSRMKNGLELPDELWRGQTGRTAEDSQIGFIHKGGLQQVFGDTYAFVDLLFCSGPDRVHPMGLIQLFFVEPNQTV